MSREVSASANLILGPPIIDWQSGIVGADQKQARILRPQSLAVLKILHDNAGKVVSKEQIMAAVWANTAVTDDSLVQCIADIRKALGDTQHSIIKTLAKRGYVYSPSPSPVNSTIASARVKAAFLNRVAMFMVGVAVVAITFALLRHGLATPVQFPAIAVMPFSNLGSDPKGDKFAEMMTEDVIIDLSHSKDFEVIARNSSDIYKGKPFNIATIGRDLKVRYVLLGSVEAMTSRVRATGILFDTTTNAPIWSQRFEEPGDDVFTVESNITNRIATSLVLHDAAAASNVRNLIHRQPPQQWSAYDAYQAGLEASHQMNPSMVPHAEEMFTKAIAIDPKFARAHLGLAWVNLLKLLYLGDVPRDQALAAMLDEAQTAVTLDPDDGEAHAALAEAYSLMHNTGKMADQTTRALSLAPNNADILVMTSYFLAQEGKSDVAVANIDQALRLNPNYPFWYNTSLYPTLFYAGEFTRSLQYAEEAALAAPTNYDFIAMAAASLRKTSQANAARTTLLSQDPTWSAEKLLTNFGALSGADEIQRLTEGATKAGLRVCLTKDELLNLPNAVHLAVCDIQRAE